MCNQRNCLHKDHVTLTPRDIAIGKAFASTLLMRIFSATENAQEAQAWSLHAGACAIDCNNPECQVSEVFEDCLRHAVDHVDNGEVLPATQMYNEVGLLVRGKKPAPAPAPSVRQAAGGLFASLVAAFGAVQEDEPQGFVDTIVVDPPPVALVIGPTPSAQIELGRMVGADRGRMSDVIDFYGEGDDDGAKLSN